MSPHPALRGRFGTTTYYVVTMSVSELVSMIRFPADLPDWKDRSPEGRFQRKIDDGRIRRHMVPYFADDDRRFCGSLVVAAEDPGDMKFESIHDVSKEPLLEAYGRTAGDLGFLTLNYQRLIPLDGQHRARAFQLALEGENSGLGVDKISVIIVGFDESLARYIFNKINKYARPTSKAGKLITDDDDAMAVITRGLITDGMMPLRLVNTESNSLNKKAPEFTLLSTFYDANRALLPVMPVPVVGRPEDMGPKERDMTQRDIAVEWKRLKSGITEWKKALDNPDEKGDKRRIELRSKSILGRPIGQLALVRGYAHAYCNMEHADKDDIVRRLDKINWDIKNNMWRTVLVKPDGRMLYGSRVANIASKLIAHLIGVRLSKNVEERLLTHIYGMTRSRNRKLPKPVA